MVPSKFGMPAIWLALVFILVVMLFSLPHAHAVQVDLKTVAGKVRIHGVVDDEDRVTLIGNRHPEAKDADDIGKVDDSLQLDRMILSLNPDAMQTAALDAFLQASHDRNSTLYGKWLTSDEFGQHFGISAQDVDAIIQWLTLHRFKIDEVTQGRRSIVFSGTAGQVRAAFHTEIHRYRHGSKEHFANASDPQIPNALAEVVNGVVSLHDFRSQPLHKRVQLAPDFTSGASHYMAAADFHTIYNLKPLYAQSINGIGRSIAILGRSNVVLSDMQKFRTTMNLPANPPQVILNGTDPGRVSGDEGESDLDLEWSGAVAPAATIKFIVSANTMTSDGIDLSAQYAVNNNVADIVSLSYGQCEASMGSTAVTFYGNLWQQAVAQGMTVLVSAGDSGAAGCDSSSASRATHGKGVNGLCTSPYSTCVGGTQFADTANPSLYWSSTTNSTDQSSVLSYIPEVVWNESGTNGGTGLWSTGGGKSIHFAKPSWQNITGVPNDGQRDVPDVSLSAASHDGYLAYSSDNTSSTQQLVAFGGTSASAPSFAGIVALIDQKTGYRQGNANVTLYGLASNQASGGPQTYFHLITSGNNSVPGVAGFSANSSTPYFNLATGLGSVDGNVLVSHWTDLLPVTSVALAASPNPSLIGQSVTFTATVSGSAPSGTVQFMDGATSMGAPVMLNSGTAALSVSSLSAGGHNITAAYSGDINNASSTSPVVTQTVATQIATTTSLSSSASSITAGQAVTLTATVTGSSPTGTVQFKDDGVALGPMINLNNGTAALNTNGLATAGNHSITADYSGNANNAASTSNMVNVTVTQAVSTVSISSSSSTSSQGQQVMFTATVSGVSPTGTVQFMDGGINLKNAVTLNNGVAKLIISTLAQGTHSITAVYSGDDNNAGSTSAAITQTVNAAVSADIPTLPEWAEIIFAMLLILIMITGNVHNTSLHLRKDK